MKKKLSLLITMVLLCSMMAMPVSAAEADMVKEDGTMACMRDITDTGMKEGAVTIEVAPAAVTSSGTSKHSVGSLNAFFGTSDSIVSSSIGSFTINSTSVPAGATISKIVVTSRKSSGSTGTIVLYVAKDEDNGDGTFDCYTDNLTWASSLTFSDFGNYDLSAAGTYYVQFSSTRYSTGTIAAATLNSIYVTVYYAY